VVLLPTPPLPDGHRDDVLDERDGAAVDLDVAGTSFTPRCTNRSF
jgi:hypothetical protein